MKICDTDVQDLRSLFLRGTIVVWRNVKCVVHELIFINVQSQVVREVYNRHMAEVLSSVEQPLQLNGDGRFDSPGHSALYGIYSFMDAKTSKIVASTLLKVCIQILHGDS